MLGVYYIMARIIVGKYIDKFKQCEMLVLSNHELAWLAHQCTPGEKHDCTGQYISLFSD